MHVGLIGLIAAGSLGFIGGGGYMYMEMVAPGEARNAIEASTDNYANVAGGLTAAPVKAFSQIRPSVQAAASEMGGVLGGAGGTTATTAAGEYADPTEGGQG